MKKQEKTTVEIIGSWENLSSIIESNSGKVYVLLDENTFEHCYKILVHEIPAIQSAEIIEIESGEENKVIGTCVGIWETLTEQNAGRDALLINLGGGVITDLGGFVASTYKRGIRFVNVPTTLLAMVDAAIGGKTGIDFMDYKNQIGTFSEAEKCFVWPGFLETLPIEELRSGFSELLKHALIADAELWNAIKNIPLEEQKFSEIIPKAIQIKSSIVKNDPLEKGQRKILNFGHTIGHALETHFLSNNKAVRHGEAVAAGMICEAYLSAQLDLTKEELKEIENEIDSHFTSLDLNEDEIEKIMLNILQDKKSVGNKNNFSLLKRIGEAVWDQEMGEESIKKSLNFYLKR